jgi:hypothetical protein
MSVTSKTCLHCKKVKPLDAFAYANRSTEPDRRAIICRECGPSLTPKQRETYIVANWRAKNLERSRQNTFRSQLKREYGLSQEQYDSMLLERESKCDICQTIITEPRKLNIDHCHKTGKVRGILCRRCNNGIAQMLDNPENLRRAAEYLERQ